MAGPGLARVLFLTVAFAPVLRVTCDVSCIRVPEPPPPCHGAAPDERPDGCSHQHGQIVARLAVSPVTLHAAILPAVVMAPIVPNPVAIHVTGGSTPLAPRASPRTVLRV